ncbi:V-type proton ATPase subunit e1 [Artemisia annua]|uniref:V-type proton ATPase subunit e1 n=1 Tax=Artemisia annua TaxID=35608 RepID=A0A2U1KHA1_ARTAN|nr:V-type proton ATPase subunit e1 [Artemisia annua]
MLVWSSHVLSLNDVVSVTYNYVCILGELFVSSQPFGILYLIPGIICVGGDGIINEVLNGLLCRDNQKEAISIPIDKVNNELTLKMAELNEKAKGSAKLFQKEEKFHLTLVITATVCCWMMWAIVYLAQMNPLIVPILSEGE